MKDYGKSVEWPRPPSMLQGLVQLLQKVHGRYVHVLGHSSRPFPVRSGSGPEVSCKVRIWSWGFLSGSQSVRQHHSQFDWKNKIKHCYLWVCIKCSQWENLLTFKWFKMLRWKYIANKSVGTFKNIDIYIWDNKVKIWYNEKKFYF